MKRLLGAALAALYAHAACAGDAVTAFRPGKPPPPEALQHVQVKAVVAEFLDPDATLLGKELGYLVWREILTALSDQRGAGVIIAHPPGNERLVDLLQQSYHEAALRIAESQKARMAVWGAVTEHEGRVVVDTYLSLIGEVTRGELALRMGWSDALKRPPKDADLIARITRTRFNFPRVRTTREALFARPLLAQHDTAVRERPGAGRTLATMRAGETLQAQDMNGEWFQVRLPNGVLGYVRSWDVYVPPRRVEALANEPLLARPGGTKGAAVAVANQAYEVLASRYVPKEGLWYRIATPQGSGWVRAFRMRTLFSFPVVHFTAGMYRYQLGRYADAAREFEQFTRSADAAADPPSLSSAYQLLGASRLMHLSVSRKDVARSSTEPDRAFAEAIRITPFDSGAYTLRAVSTLAVEQSIARALPDVAKALEYDPDSVDARNTLARIQAVSTGRGAPLPMRFKEDFFKADGASLRQRIDELARKHNVEPK